MPLVDCQYHIGNCLLCHTGTCTVRLKPFSAGERLLAIDGGGTHGVIPLDILEIIQDMMGSELQIQDLFDIAFGTSVGKLHVPISRNVKLTNGILDVFTFSMHWLGNSLNALKGGRTSLNAFASP